MRTTVVGSWPPDARYAAELARYHRGQLDNGSAEKLLIDVARETVDELTFMTEDLLGVLTPRQILLCPSCGFGRRWVRLAVDKTTVTVECAQRF